MNAPQLHSFIADQLHIMRCVDDDDFAGRAAQAIVFDEARDGPAVRRALCRVRTTLFRRNRQRSKREILETLEKRIEARLAMLASDGDLQRRQCSVLFLAASPQSQSRLALDEERRTIEQKIRGCEFASQVQLVDKWATRPDDLLQMVNETSPSIVHFSGHGAANGICLAGADGKRSAMVAGTVLTSVFKQFRDAPRVVLLNSCFSENQAKSLLGVVKCVIGMNETIADDSAAAFAGSFYRAIASGRSVLDAFEQGKLSLNLENLPDVAVPVLLEQRRDAAKVVLVGK